MIKAAARRNFCFVPVEAQLDRQLDKKVVNMTEEHARKLAFEYNVEFELVGNMRFTAYHACKSEYWLADPRGIPQYIFANPHKTPRELFIVAQQIVRKMGNHCRGSRGRPPDGDGRLFYI